MQALSNDYGPCLRNVERPPSSCATYSPLSVLPNRARFWIQAAPKWVGQLEVLSLARLLDNFWTSRDDQGVFAGCDITCEPEKCRISPAQRKQIRFKATEPLPSKMPLCLEIRYGQRYQQGSKSPRRLEFGSCHALHQFNPLDHDDTSAQSVPQFRTATATGAVGFGMLIGSSP